MILSEPPPSSYDVHFQIGEFPVRIHPYFWLTTILLGPLRDPNPNDPHPIYLILWVLAVTVSILVHELGHSLAFRYFGLGSHIVLYGMGGLAVPGWARPRHRPMGPWEHIVVSLAGPGMGFVLAAVVWALLRAAHCEVSFQGLSPSVNVPNSDNLSEFCRMMLYINIYWGLVNLLPIFPLDGGQVSQQLFHIFYPQDAERQSLILSIVVAVGMIVLILVLSKGDIQDSLFKIILFAMLGWQNYATLQSMNTRDPWTNPREPWQ